MPRPHYFAGSVYTEYFRQSARGFSGDEMALALSLRCVDRGYLDNAEVSHCQFMLMPMMHSEDLEIQFASLPLFKKYTKKQTYEYAVRHHDIVVRFGRFPHRNKVLGRPITDEENLLTEPDHHFRALHWRRDCKARSMLQLP